MALVNALSLSKISGHSLNVRLVVIIMDPRSYRFEITWKSRSVPRLSIGK